MPDDPQTARKRFGAELREARRAHNRDNPGAKVRLADLANAGGVKEITIRRGEHGDFVPRADVLRAYDERFGTDFLRRGEALRSGKQKSSVPWDLPPDIADAAPIPGRTGLPSKPELFDNTEDTQEALARLLFGVADAQGTTADRSVTMTGLGGRLLEPGGSSLRAINAVLKAGVDIRQLVDGHSYETPRSDVINAVWALLGNGERHYCPVAWYGNGAKPPASYPEFVHVSGLGSLVLFSQRAPLDTALWLPVGDSSPAGEALRQVVGHCAAAIQQVSPEHMLIRYFDSTAGKGLGEAEWIKAVVEAEVGFTRRLLFKRSLTQSVTGHRELAKDIDPEASQELLDQVDHRYKNWLLRVGQGAEDLHLLPAEPLRQWVKDPAGSQEYVFTAAPSPSEMPRLVDKMITAASDYKDVEVRVLDYDPPPILDYEVVEGARGRVAFIDAFPQMTRGDSPAHALIEITDQDLVTALTARFYQGWDNGDASPEAVRAAFGLTDPA